MKCNDDSYKMQDSVNQITLDKTTRGQTYYDGCAVTKYGIVSVMSQGFEADTTKHTRLDFAYNGRHYIRTFGEALTKKGLMHRANKFAEEIIKQKLEEN